jgi:hypothetical protein
MRTPILFSDGVRGQHREPPFEILELVACQRLVELRGVGTASHRRQGRRFVFCRLLGSRYAGVLVERITTTVRRE